MQIHSCIMQLLNLRSFKDNVFIYGLKSFISSCQKFKPNNNLFIGKQCYQKQPRSNLLYCFAQNFIDLYINPLLIQKLENLHNIYLFIWFRANSYFRQISHYFISNEKLMHELYQINLLMSILRVIDKYTTIHHSLVYFLCLLHDFLLRNEKLYESIM